MHKRFILLILIFIFSLTALLGCSANKDTNRGNTINIGALKGPTMMGFSKLEEEYREGTSINKYNFLMEATIDPITAGLGKGTLDAAAIPSNSAAILFNKSALDISVAAINVLGVLNVVTTRTDINSVADLKGKSIIMTGLNVVPQYTFEYLLKSYNINPSTDLNIEFIAETEQAVARLINKSSDIAVLPQPFVASALKQVSGLQIALNVNEEWAKIESLKETPPITAVLVVRNNYLKYNKQTFDKFLDEYKASVEYMINPDNIDKAAELIAALNIIPNAAIAKAALPGCNLTYCEGDEMKTKLEAFFNILLAGNTNSIGGKLPVETFYYKR